MRILKPKIIVFFFFFSIFCIHLSKSSPNLDRGNVGVGYYLHDAITKKDAKCIDGSAPGYYYIQGYDSGSHKWYIHFEGGGWCVSLEDCFQRSQTDLGSTLKDDPEMTLNWDYWVDSEEDNPMLYNWNKVLLRYCDGGSFSGNSEVKFNNITLHFKGKNIMNAIFDDLIENRGLLNSTDIIISGASAGGLATYLHVDHVHKRIRSLPGERKLVALPDSGFFLDFTGDNVDYHSQMKWVFSTMNCKDGVNEDCIAFHSDEEQWKCFFAEHTIPFVKTPIFALQPRFDSWQADNVLGNRSEDKMNNFGTDLLGRLKKSLFQSERNSAFVDSCFHHCGYWSKIHINDVTQAEAFSDWYEQLYEAPLIQDGQYVCDKCCS